MCPSLRYVLLWSLRRGGSSTVLPLHSLQRAVCAGYSHEFESSAHWSSLICIGLSWLFEASPLSAGLEGGAEEVLSWGNPITYSPLSPPPVGLENGTWNRREFVSPSCGRSAITADILTSEVPAHVSSLSFCPPLLSPPWVSDSLCAHLTDLRAQWSPSTCSTPRWFVLLDSPRHYKDHDLLAIKLNRSSQRPKCHFQTLPNAWMLGWESDTFIVRCFPGSSWTSPVWK